MKCSKPSPYGRSHSHVNSTMGGDSIWRPEDLQAPNLLPNLAPKAKYLETIPLTFRGKKATRTNIEVEVEEQDSTSLEVEEDLPLEEGEDPHIKTLGGKETIKSGMNSSHLAQEPTKNSTDGRKIPGLNTREKMHQDPKETIIKTQI